MCVCVCVFTVHLLIRLRSVCVARKDYAYLCHLLTPPPLSLQIQKIQIPCLCIFVETSMEAEQSKRERRENSAKSEFPTPCFNCDYLPDDPAIIMRSIGERVQRAVRLPSCPFQVANQATPEQCVTLFEEAALKEACRVAGISFDNHALVTGYIAQAPQYMNGVLHHLSENKCAAVAQALALMFTAMNPVVNTWGFWSSQIQGANDNPLGEIMVVRSGSLVEVLASLRLRGAFAP